MGIVIAAVDSSAAAGSVLSVARAVAPLFHADVEAVHVLEDGGAAARAAGQAAGVKLSEISGPTVPALVTAARTDEVVAMVVGARGTPAGRRPAGHVALEVITTLRKPLVVVPPHAAGPSRLARVLVPLDGSAATAAALRSTIDLVCGSEAEVVVLHVYEEASLPAFSDQPQHETESWAKEFLARYCPASAHGVRLELRVGAPGEHVLAVAVEENADLIALGWAQDLSTGRAAVVREVLERSSVPVLLVPVDA